jgi:hypothetical protein
MTDSFKDLQNQVIHLYNLLEHYRKVTEVISTAKMRLAGGFTELTPQVKQRIQQKLEDAANSVDAMCTLTDLKSEIQYARTLLQNTEPYVQTPQSHAVVTPQKPPAEFVVLYAETMWRRLAVCEFQ